MILLLRFPSFGSQQLRPSHFDVEFSRSFLPNPTQDMSGENGDTISEELPDETQEMNPDSAGISSAANLEISPCFLCGVIEGFYGRPWTKEQRVTLFQRMNDLGLNTYIYAPKDDYKHRAFWRQPYSPNEINELAGLIKDAKDNDIQFHYAISPGIDILFSSERDVTALKKKLQQLKQCGCEGKVGRNVSKMRPTRTVFQGLAKPPHTQRHAAGHPWPRLSAWPKLVARRTS
jgi:hypothetical protein